MKQEETLTLQGPFQLLWEKASGLNWEKHKAFWVILGIFLEV